MYNRLSGESFEDDISDMPAGAVGNCTSGLEIEETSPTGGGAGEQEYTYFEESFSPCPDVKTKTQKHEVCNDEALRAMYQELQLISAQLKTKNMELSQREKQLNDREMRLTVRTEELEVAYKKLAFNLHKAVDHETTEKQKKTQEKVTEAQDQLKDKTKENKRLRANFDALQEVNSQLRKQFDDVNSRNLKLEKQCHSLKQRLENLQRCQELKDRQTENIVSEMKSAPIKARQKPARISRVTSVIQGTGSDVFTVLLEWIIKDILKPSFERGRTLDGSLRVHILDNCQKMLPSLVEIIRETTNQSQSRLCLPCLQFIYWSCLLLDHNPGKQNVGLGGAQRKLADELYRPIRPDENEIPNSNVFVKSSDTQIRLLSCLLLLRNLTQVDCIANVFSLLKHDLRDDLIKELFVYYHGTSILLLFFKPTAKAQLAVVLDIYMLMCVESAVLQSFLLSCSNESWFRSAAMVLKIPSLDLKQLEKVSVILQKLSKTRDNRRHFDMFSLKTVIQDVIHSTPSSDTSSFLILNLKSVLFNLSSSPSTADD